MSAFLSLDLQVEILRRLPVKSLLQCRSVCKAWMSLISSPSFIADYLGPDTQPYRLLIRCNDRFDFEERYLSVVDDDTLFQQQFTLIKPDFNEVDFLSTIVGCSNGLFCLYGIYNGYFYTDLIMHAAVLWNPSIRKSVVVRVPNVSISPYKIVLGFGVCPSSLDPKIVKITYIDAWWEMDGITGIPWQVEVFSLSSGCWKSPRSTGSDASRPRTTIAFSLFHVVTDQFIHWLAHDRMVRDGWCWSYNMVMSFDMVSEEFREMELPGRLAHQSASKLSISKVGQFPAVLGYERDAEKEVCTVWVIDEYGEELGIMLFAIEVSHLSIKTLGFRMNGDPIIELKNDDKASLGQGKVVICEPHSGDLRDLGIYARRDSFFVKSYMETLLLLDQPNGVIYPLAASQNHGEGGHLVSSHNHGGGGP